MKSGINTLPPLSLYIHIPWCNKKCPYCDFNVHVNVDKTAIPEDLYLRTLLADLEGQMDLVQSRKLYSIFIGGGTPNLISADFYYKLIKQINSLIPLHPDIEITIEANPGVRQKAQLEQFIDAGINRLSLGIQSFHDPSLKLLGREHSARDNHLTIAAARSAGFTNINLDLIYGIPKQAQSHISKDLLAALDYAPEHISHYQLNIEPNSIFYSHLPKGIPDQAIITEAMEASEVCLTNQAYQHYEISAFAKAGKQSRHNLNYWQFGDYLGIGAGAHAKVTKVNLLQTQEIIRYQKTRKPKSYLADKGYRPIQIRKLTTKDLIIEFMLNAMRLKQGVPLALFSERTGCHIEQLKEKSQEPLRRKLINMDDGIIKPTELGMRYHNDLLLCYLDD